MGCQLFGRKRSRSTLALSSGPQPSLNQMPRNHFPDRGGHPTKRWCSSECCLFGIQNCSLRNSRSLPQPQDHRGTNDTVVGVFGSTTWIGSAVICPCLMVLAQPAAPMFSLGLVPHLLSLQLLRLERCLKGGGNRRILGKCANLLCQASRAQALSPYPPRFHEPLIRSAASTPKSHLSAGVAKG